MIGHSSVRWDSLTLSVDIEAYADGDLLADTQELVNFLPYAADKSIILQSLHVLDEAAQSKAMDILFLTAGDSVGTENAAAAITDALARGIVGAVKVLETDYISLGSTGSYAIPQFCPMVMAGATNAATALYVAVISRGTPTYTGAEQLKLRLGFLVARS
jgi:hypothetical protein